jgi:hypothetical protein
MKTNKEIKDYIECSCYSEGVFIQYESDEKLTYISFYKLGANPVSLNWWNKLRYICQVIFKGAPFHDQLILKDTEVKKLHSVLGKIIKNS